MKKLIFLLLLLITLNSCSEEPRVYCGEVTDKYTERQDGVQVYYKILYARELQKSFKVKVDPINYDLDEKTECFYIIPYIQ